MNVFVARQPIFNVHRQVIGYELLYRDSCNNYFDLGISSSKATSILLTNTYFTFGIRNLVENSLAFINFDKELINNEIPLLLDNSKVVIELLENINPNDKFMKRIKSLKSKGYKIAIDDFTKDYPHNDIIEISDIIKVDFMKSCKVEIQEICDKYLDQGKTLLAEKVETNEMFNWAKDMGFKYFQGYFFSKPMILKSRGMKDNRLSYIKIIEELSQKEPFYDKITKIIESDTILTYKLLKIISSKFSLLHEISSVNHALALLGLNELEKWVSLVMIQDMGKYKPNELIRAALFRAKFGELIAISSTKLSNHAHEIVLIGLLSVIDAILESPMEQILHTLPITAEINNTLLGSKTKYSDIYDLVLNYEKANWKDVTLYVNNLEINMEALPELYIEAIKWADGLFDYFNNLD